MELILIMVLLFPCRSHILKDCISVVDQACKVIHSAIDDPDIPLSPKELRWLGSSAYNLGCVTYQRDCFVEAVPLLIVACDELRFWCFAAESEKEILTRIEEVILKNIFKYLWLLATEIDLITYTQGCH